MHSKMLMGKDLGNGLAINLDEELRDRPATSCDDHQRRLDSVNCKGPLVKPSLKVGDSSLHANWES